MSEYMQAISKSVQALGMFWYAYWTELIPLLMQDKLQYTCLYSSRISAWMWIILSHFIHFAE